MILDGYWKQDLHQIKSRLVFWCRMGFADFAEHQINRGMLYSAVIIRKIVEDEKDAEGTVKKHQWPKPALPILKITVPIVRYQHTDKDNFFANSRVFLDDYDMKNGQADDLPLMQICNQIIHSYAWAVVYQGKNGIYGVLLASDREKETDIILLTVSDWINAIQRVIKEANI